MLIKDIQNRKEVKLYTDDTILYIETFQNPQKIC